MARGIHLTIDEWFYHWFEEGHNYKQVATFFIEILKVCDKIVLQKGTRLAQKFYALCEASYSYPPLERQTVKLLMRSLISNIDKIYWVDETEKLTENIVSRLPRKDVYLVEICLMTHDKILITTDFTLHQNLIDLHNELGIVVSFAEDFIQHYPELIV